MNNYTSTSSWMVVASAIILVGATYLAPRPQPTTLRPFTAEPAATRPLSADSVQARLWQDPVEVGWKRIGTPLSGGQQGHTSKKQMLWRDWLHAPQTLQSMIDDVAAESLFYLPILLSGKPYPEARERRLRYRLALQEAMETMEYRPQNYDSLYYFPVPNLSGCEPGSTLWADETPESSQCQQALTEDDYLPVTYEIFEYIGKNQEQMIRRVVVFWVDSRLVNRGGAPNYRNLEAMLLGGTAGNAAKRIDNGAVISLAGSDELLSLIVDGDQDSLPDNQKLSLNYAVSTAPMSQFVSKLRGTVINARIAEQVVRSVPSDNYVLAAIVDELQRRIPGFGMDKGQEHGDEVWLLSEQDTFYSQVMNDEFEAITTKRQLHVKVKSIGFLKGIDGNLPDDQAAAEAKSLKSISNLTDLVHMLNQGSVPEQRLFDRRQIDYLQRLAEKLQQEQRRKPFPQRVKAIGILGGDVYDKMLVLEVFRHYFPATNYFTTDLDSAYLYGPHAKTARNLIIGSSFGLSPLALKDVFHDDAAGEVVFRDSYQTVLYHTILKLLWPQGDRQAFEEAFNKDFGIGVFEVGRSKFHLLETGPESLREQRYSWHYPASLGAEPMVDSTEEASGDGDLSLRAPFAKTFAASERPFSMMIEFGPLSLMAMIVIFAAIILAAVWLFIRSIQKHELLPQELGASSPHFVWRIVTNTQQKKFKRLSSFPVSLRFFSWGVGIFGIIGATVLLIVAPGYLNNLFDGLEPMYWVEGISAWPSILLRMAIFLVGVVMLASSLARSNVAINRLKTRLASRQMLSAHPDTNQDYSQTRLGGALSRDLLIIFILTVMLMAMMFVILNITSSYSDGFFTPGRGHWVFLGHEISIALSLSTLLLLVWWAAFRHYRSRTFLVALNKELYEARMSAGDGASSGDKPDVSLSAEEIGALEDYAGISSVTLLPPFAMMVLLVVSRHNIFDGWNIPLVLILFLSFMLFILLISAFQLSSAARHLKLAELNYHRISAEPDIKKRKTAIMASLWQDAAGPFGKYQQQPIIQALLFAAAGFGISFIEPMFNFFGI